MEEINATLKSLKKKLDNLRSKFDVDKKLRQISQLEAKTLEAGFWDNDQKARQVTQKMANIKQNLDSLDSLTDQISQALSLVDLAKKETNPDDIAKDLSQEIKSIKQAVSKLEKESYLSGPHDHSDAIVSIHSGQGGTEAMDWAAMLVRMYTRFFEKKGWEYEIINESLGEEAGIKSTTLIVHADLAYGFLRGEAGTHRLVRQSPFNADNLRQTSFALVGVLPVIDEVKDFDVKEEDIEFKAFRSSGKGGQNVNKVSTAVRLKHIPSGIVVESQTQRHQEQNRKTALKLLKAKLWQKKEEKRLKKVKNIKGEHKIAGWGNQIRSYVLHPYKLVKDLRTKIESTEPEKVLDGQLNDFIEAEIRYLAQV